MVVYKGKEIRIKNNESVRSLAKKAEVSMGTISKWENGKATPDLPVLEIVANVLHVNPWDLIAFEN